MTVERLERTQLEAIPPALRAALPSAEPAEAWWVHFVESRRPAPLLWLTARSEAFILDSEQVFTVSAAGPYAAAQQHFGPQIPYPSRPEEGTSW